MAKHTKFEVVRTRAIESGHTSLNSNNGTEYKAGLEPQALSWWQAGKFVGVMMDMLAIALSCTFFVYALAVKMHENKPMNHPRVKVLLKLSNLVRVQIIKVWFINRSNMADRVYLRVPLSILSCSPLSLVKPSSRSRFGSSRGVVGLAHLIDSLAV